MMHPRAKEIRRALKGLPFEVTVTHNRLYGYTAVKPRCTVLREVTMPPMIKMVEALVAAGYPLEFRRHGCGIPALKANSP